MNQLPHSSVVKTSPKSRRYPVFAFLAKTLLATGLLLGVVLGGLEVSGRTEILSLFRHGDNLTDAQTQERLAAINALGEVPLDVVEDKDIQRAVESMQLPSSEKEALLNDLKEQSSSTPSAQAPKTLTSLAPARKAAIKKERRRLVWLSLWDINDAGGDVVQIDSQGYLRTIVLTKQPTVFAVPTSSDGHWILKITGISDVDGKGITVGLSSRASRVVLPLMRARQDFGLRVKVD